MSDEGGCNWRESFLHSLIGYETPRLVKVHNVTLGLVMRFSQLMVIAYVISYAIVYERGYQVLSSSGNVCKDVVR